MRGANRCCAASATASLIAPTEGWVWHTPQRLSGYSHAQITRLVSRRTVAKPLVKSYRRPERAFARRYTPADVALLAKVVRAMA